MAETKLVETILDAMPDGKPTLLLNAGAGDSPWIEYQLHLRRTDFVSDRIDVEPPTVAEQHLPYAHVGRSWTGSIESMPQVPTAEYDVVFANYVFEHLADVRAAAAELRRVVRPGGVAVITVSNPTAPEMRLARITPLWVHRLVRGIRAWPLRHGFRDLDELASIFEQCGFRRRGIHRFPNVSFYLARIPVLGRIARLYDGAVERLRLERWAGAACLVFDRDA